MTKQTLMAVGAHADDIELNVGGTLAKYCDVGYTAVYVMTTNNFSGIWCRRRPDGSIDKTKPPHDVIEPQRKREAEAGAKAFHTKPIHLDFPQRHYTRADGTVAEVRYGCDLPAGVPPDVPTILTAYEHEPSVQRVADLILAHQPEAILTHGVAAENIEHFATSLLMANAYGRATRAGYRGALLLWPELGATTFGRLNYEWNTFVDVTDSWERKLAAIALHESQIPTVDRLDFPAWGPTCGCGRAEVFSLIGEPRPLRASESSFTLEILKHWR
jgi:LmbE family N-acetylglucosaminyl deacetylase